MSLETSEVGGGSGVVLSKGQVKTGNRHRITKEKKTRQRLECSLIWGKGGSKYQGSEESKSILKKHILLGGGVIVGWGGNARQEMDMDKNHPLNEKMVAVFQIGTVASQVHKNGIGLVG